MDYSKLEKAATRFREMDARKRQGVIFTPEEEHEYETLEGMYFDWLQLEQDILLMGEYL